MATKSKSDATAQGDANGKATFLEGFAIASGARTVIRSSKPTASIQKSGRLSLHTALVDLMEIADNSFYQVAFPVDKKGNPTSVDQIILIPCSANDPDAIGVVATGSAASNFNLNVRTALVRRGFEYKEKSVTYLFEKLEHEGVEYFKGTGKVEDRVPYHRKSKEVEA